MIIDLDDVLGRIQGDKELLVELIEIFLDDCPQKVSEIKKCFEISDFGQLSELSHSIKGAAANIGAKKISYTFLQAEEAANSQNIDGFGQLIERMDQEFDELTQYFPELKIKLA